jgi:hypothetical protein
MVTVVTGPKPIQGMYLMARALNPMKGIFPVVAI